VILIDANLLLYAVNGAAPEHARARDWLDKQLTHTPRVGMPWSSLLAFLRIATNPRVFNPPLAMSRAWKQVEAWLDIESVWIPEPTRHHRQVLGELMQTNDIRAHLVPDAHLAALAIEHGLTLCSTDGDFAKFSALKWTNPLVT